MTNASPRTSPDDNRVFFLVPLLSRFVTDFGAVAWQLSALGIPSSIYAPAAAESSTVWWKSVETINAYAERLPPGMERVSLPMQRDRRTITSAIRTMAMAWRIGRAFPDAIFVCWTIMPILFCGLPLRFMERRCVFLLTGMGTIFGSDRLQHRLVRAVVKPMYRYLFSGTRSRVIVHNAEDKQYLMESLGIDQDHVTVTPGCGVDPDEFPFFEEFVPKGRKVILVPIRLLREKGVFDAAAASDELSRRGVDHEMWFSSAPDEGNPSSLTQRDIEAIEQSSRRVKFIGYQPSLVPSYQACDIVCVPTKYREGLPTALLEAAASGRPIVTCDNIGGREFITDGENGLIVPRAAPIALADAIERLIKDQQLTERLRRKAFRHFQRGFTKDVMVARTLAVFRDLGMAVPSGVSSGARAVERNA
jgi:glycosyltransferase involved in cell wall biosynthesis